MSETSSQDSLYSSREFRSVLAAVGILLLIGYTILAFLAERTRVLMVDMTTWEARFTATGQESPVSHREFARFFESVQSPIKAQRPFRVTLQLPRTPVEGDIVTVSRTFPAMDSGTYCFEVLTFSEYYQPDSARAVDTFEVRIRAQDTIMAAFPIGDRKEGQLLQFNDLKATNGNIRIQFELLARNTRTRPFWQRASTVHFEHARFYPCSR